MQESRPYTFDRVVRTIFTVGLLCGIIWLLGYLSDVLIPFAVALLLAYLVNPLVLQVQKKIRNRTAAVFISLFLISGISILLIVLITPLIINEIVHMGKVLSDVASNSAIADRAVKLIPPDLWQAIQDYAGRKEIQTH